MLNKKGQTYNFTLVGKPNKHTNMHIKNDLRHVDLSKIGIKNIWTPETQKRRIR
jgi:hypothetical protein